MTTLVGTVILGSTLVAMLLGQVSLGAEAVGVIIAALVLMSMRGA